MSLSAAPSSTSPDGTLSTPEVDASFRAVALLSAAMSALWLVIGAFVSLVASVKLHAPGMMSGAAWLTYGRLLPAGWDALVYGFALQSGLVLGLWVLARAAAQRLQAPLLVVVGSLCWNVGLLAGLLGILAGHSTGREWLEMPPAAMAVLIFGAGLIGTSGWLTFAARTRTDTYPSAWFVLLGLLSFVWFGSVALLSFAGEGSTGVVQVLVQRWYAGGLVRLTLGGLALGVIFHWLPLVVGRPLASRQLALVGFWTLVFFAPWAVTAHGDPFPRWLVSVGIAGQMLATIGWMAIVLNWWKTVEGATSRLTVGFPGRLIGAAAVAYILGGALQFLTSLRGPASMVRFTWLQSGLDWVLVGGVAMLAFVGVLPVFLEQATGRRLAAPLVGAHAWLTLVGIGVVAVSMILAGLIQGAGLGAPESGTFLDVLRRSLLLVRMSSLGLTIFLLGQLVWLVALASVYRALVMEGVAKVREWAAPLPTKGVARS